MKFIQKLQQKSDAEKRVVAFNVAFFITLIIFGVWAVSTFYTFGSGLDGDIKQTASPISVIKETVTELFNGGVEVYESQIK